MNTFQCQYPTLNGSYTDETNETSSIRIVNIRYFSRPPFTKNIFLSYETLPESVLRTTSDLFPGFSN